MAGQRPVDMVVLPRPSSPRKGREEGKASVSVPSKMKIAAVCAHSATAALYAYTAAASTPISTPAIVNSNGTTVDDPLTRVIK